MGVQEQINRITSNISSSYTVAAEMGATMPSLQNSANLAATILTIPTNTGGVELPDPIVAGDTPVILNTDIGSVTSTSLTATGCTLTIPKDGTYRIKYCAVRFTTSGTFQSQLYKNGTAISSTLASFTSGEYSVDSAYDIECAAGDVLEVYLRSRSSSYGIACYYLAACIDWDVDWGSSGGGSSDSGDTGGGDATLINFVVGSTESYQAESGMTWTEWVASSYNTDSVFSISGDYVKKGSYLYVKYGSSKVSASAEIIANAAYTLATS